VFPRSHLGLVRFYAELGRDGFSIVLKSKIETPSVSCSGQFHLTAGLGY